MKAVHTLVFVLAMQAASAQATLIIDAFDSGPFNENTIPDSLNVGPAVPVEALGQTALPPDRVLGGQRYARLEWLSGPAQASAKLYSVSTGGLRFNNESDTRSTLSLWYGLAPNGTPTPLGANLLAGGQTSFGLYARTDAPDHPLNIQIELADGAGSSAVGSATISNVAWGWTNIPFTAYAGVDLADVARIRLVLTPQPGVSALDAAVGQFLAVPEPSAAGLLMVGAAGLIRSRRRPARQRCAA